MVIFLRILECLICVTGREVVDSAQAGPQLLFLSRSGGPPVSPRGDAITRGNLSSVAFNQLFCVIWLSGRFY